MMTKAEVDPADPKEAVRLVRTYPQIVTAVLSKHDGRAYTNLVAAYALVWSTNKEVPTLLFKAAKRAPGMSKLVASFLANLLMNDEAMWRKIWTPELQAAHVSMQESDDFAQIFIEASK